MSLYRRITQRCAITALLVMLAAATPVAAAEFDRGRALYENHCQACHEDGAHTRGDRTVTSLDGLRARVASWSVHSGLQWSAEEIEEVTAYLNRRFYQLAP